MRSAKACAVALLLCSCGAAKADFDDICNAEQRSGVTGETDPTQKAVKIAMWLQGRLRTSEAKKFLSAMASVDPAQKGNLLRTEAAKHGVSPCPIADSTWGKP
jgi:hypothetical protein